MAQRTKEQLQTLVNLQINTNGVGAITGEKMRLILSDFIDSLESEGGGLSIINRGSSTTPLVTALSSIQYNNLGDTWFVDELGAYVKYRFAEVENVVSSVNGKPGPAVTLVPADLGLGNVDNTSDMDKPVSTAMQAILSTKQNVIGYVPVPDTRTINGYSLQTNVTIGKSDIGLGNVDNTSDADKPLSTATISALANKQNSLGYIPVPETRTVNNKSLDVDIFLDKNDIGLFNVDNTADLQKPISNATQSALDGKSPLSHTHSIANITGLQVALDAKISSNAAIVGATKTKITYDSNGLIIAGGDLVESDIPQISQSKVNNLTADLANKADLVGGLIPTSQIPNIAISEFLGSVATQAAMLTLSGQKGDWVIRTDENKVYIITGDDGTVIGNWTALSYPNDAVTSVNGQTGIIVLGKSDIGLGNVDNTSDVNKPISTAMQTALDLKSDLTNTVTITEDQNITGIKTFAPTIPATANNQNLTAVVINPTFNVGAFTGTKSNYLQFGSYGFLGIGVGGNPRLSASSTALVIIEGAAGVVLGKNTNSNAGWVNMISSGDTKHIAAFINSGSARVATITDGGNVLFGTTTDNGERLQVSGTSALVGNVSIGSQTASTTSTIYGATNTNILQLRNINSGNPIFDIIMGSVNGTASTYSVSLKTRQTGGQIYLGGYLGTGITINDNNNIFIGATTDNGFADKLQVSGTVRATNFKLGTYGSVVTEDSARMFLQARGNKFDVLTSDAGAFVVSFSKDTATHVFYGNSNSQFKILPEDNRIQGGSASGGYIDLYNPGTGNVSIVNISTTAAFGNIRFLTQSSEAGRFSTAGNFLLGTTTDGTNKLHVVGTTYSDKLSIGSASTDASYLGFFESTTATTYVTLRNNMNTSATNYLRFLKQKANSYILTAGDIVGALDFNAGMGSFSAVANSTTNTAATHTTVDFLWRGYRDASIVDLMRLYATGNLSIATTHSDTGYKLYVQSNVDSIIAGSGLFSNSSTGTSAAALVAVQSATAGGFVGAYNDTYSNTTFADRIVLGTNSNASGVTIYAGSAVDQDIRFVVQSGEAARIIQGGNFMIGGTTDNGNKLQVTGGIHLTGAMTVGGQYIYGDTTSPFIRLSNGAGLQYGYGTNYFSVGGAGFTFTSTAGTAKTYIQYRTIWGMRLDDANAATDPQADNLRAVLALTSTTKGFLPPRLTTAQKDAIATPPDGLIVYDSDLKRLALVANSAWVALATKAEVDAMTSLPATTAGSVLFSDGTNVTQDNDNFFYDNLNNRLGLGTNVPTHSLTLGSTQNTIALYSTADQATNFQRLAISGTSGNVWSFDLQKGGTGVAGGMNFKVNGVNAIDINSTYMLDVTGTIRATENVTLNKNISIGAGSVSGTAYSISITSNLPGIGSRGGLYWNGTGTGVETASITAVRDYASSNHTGLLFKAANYEFMRMVTYDAVGAVYSIGIGTSTPNASSIVDMTSTTKGLLIPRMTTTNRGNITSPAVGLLIFNTTDNEFQFYNGVSWMSIGAAAGGGGEPATWGSISGTLSSQTDLQLALDGKVSATGNQSILGVKTFSDIVKLGMVNTSASTYDLLTRNGAGEIEKIPSTTFAPARTKVQQAFTATAGQTTFVVAGGYEAGTVDVFLNGSKLNPAEYTATDGSNVVLTNAAGLNDVIEVNSYVAFNDLVNYSAVAATTYNITPTDKVLLIESTLGSTHILNLPPAASANHNGYTIKNIGDGELRINPSAGETIDGQTYILIGKKYTSIALIKYNNNWFIV